MAKTKTKVETKVLCARTKPELWGPVFSLKQSSGRKVSELIRAGLEKELAAAGDFERFAVKELLDAAQQGGDLAEVAGLLQQGAETPKESKFVEVTALKIAELQAPKVVRAKAIEVQVAPVKPGSTREMAREAFKKATSVKGLEAIKAKLIKESYSRSEDKVIKEEAKIALLEVRKQLKIQKQPPKKPSTAKQQKKAKPHKETKAVLAQIETFKAGLIGDSVAELRTQEARIKAQFPTLAPAGQHIAGHYLQEIQKAIAAHPQSNPLPKGMGRAQVFYPTGNKKAEGYITVEAPHAAGVSEIVRLAEKQTGLKFAKRGSKGITEIQTDKGIFYRGGRPFYNSSGHLYEDIEFKTWEEKEAAPFAKREKEKQQESYKVSLAKSALEKYQTVLYAMGDAELLREAARLKGKTTAQEKRERALVTAETKKRAEIRGKAKKIEKLPQKKKATPKKKATKPKGLPAAPKYLQLPQKVDTEHYLTGVSARPKEAALFELGMKIAEDKKMRIRRDITRDERKAKDLALGAIEEQGWTNATKEEAKGKAKRYRTMGQEWADLGNIQKSVISIGMANAYDELAAKKKTPPKEKKSPELKKTARDAAKRSAQRARQKTPPGLTPQEENAERLRINRERDYIINEATNRAQAAMKQYHYAKAVKHWRDLIDAAGLAELPDVQKTLTAEVKGDGLAAQHIVQMVDHRRAELLQAEPPKKKETAGQRIERERLAKAKAKEETKLRAKGDKEEAKRQAEKERLRKVSEERAQKSPKAEKAGEDCEGEGCEYALTGGKCSVKAPLMVGAQDGGVYSAPARYCLIEIENLKASHQPLKNYSRTPGYPKDAQERDYEHEKGEQFKVQKIADAYEPSLIFSKAPGAIDGIPVANEDGVVLGGNGRTMATMLIYGGAAKTKSSTIRDYLTQHAKEFGFTAAQVSQFAKPMIVRTIRTKEIGPAEVSYWSRRLNQSMSQTLNPTLIAVSRAKFLRPAALAELAQLPENETIAAWLSTQASRGFVRSLMDSDIIDTRTSATFLAPGGLLSAEGRDLVNDLLVAVLIPNAAVIKSLGPQTTATIGRAAPYLAQLGALGEYNVLPEFKAAANDLILMRANGFTDVPRFLSQKGMFGVVPETQGNPIAETWLEILHQLGDSPAKLGKLARHYLQLAKAPSSGQMGLLASENFTPLQALRHAAKAQGVKV